MLNVGLIPIPHNESPLVSQDLRTPASYSRVSAAVLVDIILDD